MSDASVEPTTSTSTEDSTPLLEVSDLHAGYGQLTIVHGVDLVAAPGSSTLVFGPNGSGKSTLLKALVGLVDIMGGTISFDGTDITASSTEGRVAGGLAMVPQTENIFRDLTVAENLEIGGFLDRDRTAERMEMVIDLFPLLGDRLGAWAGNLSGGEQQLVAIGRALMIEPRLLLLDEPSAGLAPRLVEETFDHVRRVNEEYGVAILLVEQNVRQALPLVDRAVLMEGGEIRLAGPRDEVAQAPEIARSYLGDD